MDFKKTYQGIKDAVFPENAEKKQVENAVKKIAAQIKNQHSFYRKEIREWKMARIEALDNDLPRRASLVQIAEGSLGEVSNILIRLRELSVQAASDTIGSTERKFLNVEFEQLTSEVDRIANSTEFNRVPLLNGTGAVFDIQIGTRNDPISDRLTFDASSADVNVAALGLNLASVADKISAQNSLSSIDQAIVSVSGIRADFGALQNRLQSTIKNSHISVENLSAANSRVRDTDIASATAELTKNNILMQAGTSVLAQANQSTTSALTLIQQAAG